MNNNEKDNNVNNQEILGESVSSITDIVGMDETLAKSNREKYTGKKTRVLEEENFTNEKVVPLVYLESTVNDNEGKEPSTEYIIRQHLRMIVEERKLICSIIKEILLV